MPAFHAPVVRVGRIRRVKLDMMKLVHRKLVAQRVVAHKVFVANELLEYGAGRCRRAIGGAIGSTGSHRGRFVVSCAGSSTPQRCLVGRCVLFKVMDDEAKDFRRRSAQHQLRRCCATFTTPPPRVLVVVVRFNTTGDLNRSGLSRCIGGSGGVTVCSTGISRRVAFLYNAHPNVQYLLPGAIVMMDHSNNETIHHRGSTAARLNSIRCGDEFGVTPVWSLHNIINLFVPRPCRTRLHSFFIRKIIYGKTITTYACIE